MFAELDAKASRFRETLLCISGAIQMLEEELKEWKAEMPAAE